MYEHPSKGLLRQEQSTYNARNALETHKITYYTGQSGDEAYAVSQTNITYNAQGQISSITGPFHYPQHTPPSSLPAPQWQYTYNTQHQLASITNAVGLTTRIISL